MRLTIFLPLLLISGHLFSQHDSATTRKVQLPDVKIETLRPMPSGEIIPDVNGFQIAAGRKTNLVRMDNRTADLTSGLYRQALAKVAGITIWENDGSGIQTSIATRGLSPNRSWEFNMRQDGADISAEIFGYPEAYYTPPLEAVERIDITRGAASLAYGPQFGGAVNYIIRKAQPGSPLRFESSQTLGSFGTFNSFQFFSGSRGKFFWTSWLHHRSSNGWRDNSRYFTRTGFVSIGYAFRPNLRLEANTTILNMESQQPGGLFDEELKTNPVKSHRPRNWISTPWDMAGISLQHEVSNAWNYELKLFGNISERNSVGFVNQLQIPDAILPATGQFAARQIDRDLYRNGGFEFRNLVRWKMMNLSQTLTAGMRAYQGETSRLNNGKGGTGNDYDLRLTEDYQRNLHYRTRNVAVFAEQLLQFGEGFTLTPGARLEYLFNTSKGRIGTGTVIPEASKTRIIPLLGISAAWKKSEKLELYGNIAQAYRPVTFAELTPSALTESIDPNLRDAKGFNAETGLRGQATLYGSGLPFFIYDVNVFFLRYENRIGLLNNLRTNIGNSESRGIEAYLEFRPLVLAGQSSAAADLSVFVSGTTMRAEYFGWKDKSSDRSGKKVEYAPDFSMRAGIQYQRRGFNFSGTWSYTGGVYSDALNSRTPSPNAQAGWIPAWQTIDISAGYGFYSHYMIKAGVNNLLDERYATRRASGYPGPGLMPGQARNLYLGFSARF
jgi:Fe(3+) dicitrate transport protein